MDTPRFSRERVVVFLAALVALQIAVVDAFIPLEAAVGILYVPVILLALQTRQRRIVLGFASATSALNTADLFLSPRGVGSVVWSVFDHAAAFAAIWATAWLALRELRTRAALNHSQTRYRLLWRETDHRLRSYVSFLRAMTDMYADAESCSKGELARLIRARLDSITAGQDLLGREHFGPVPLAELARAVVPAARAGRVRLIGPDVMLPPDQVTPVGVILHELMLNSARYGALGVESGRVDLRWALHKNGAAAARSLPEELDAQPEPVIQAGRLEFCWQESGGPPICIYPNAHTGTRLVESFVREVLGGEIQLAYPQGGAFHTFSVLLGAKGPGVTMPQEAIREPKSTSIRAPAAA